MIRIIGCLLLLSFINSLTAQDSTKFERVYIWEYKSSELSGSGEQFASSVCDTIRNHFSNNKNVTNKLEKRDREYENLLQEKHRIKAQAQIAHLFFANTQSNIEKIK